jgi:hypothetical protein
MQTNLTLKRRIVIFSMGLALALAAAASLGLRGSSHPARLAAQPLAVAVNWNSFAVDSLDWPQG